MKIRKTLVAGVAAPLLLLTACAGGGTGAGETGEAGDVIKIGTLNPLTGPAVAYGEDAKRGTELAAKEINARPGACFDGATIELVHEDDMASADGAVTGMNKLMREDIQAVVGGASSTSSLAAASVTAEQLLHINTLSQADEIAAQGGSMLYMVNNTVSQFADNFNGYVTEDLGIESIVYIGEESVFNAGTFPLLEEDLAEGGVELLDTGNYQTGSTDFTSILNRLNAANADAIYIAAGNPSDIANILQQANQVGDFGTKIIAPGNISEAVISAAGDNIEGVISGDIYTSTLDTEANQAFVEAFQAEYDGLTPGRPELTNYEGIYIVCEAMNAAGTSTDKQAIAEAIQGLTIETPRGNLSWNEDHWAIADNFFIVEVQDGKSVVLDTVPRA